MDYKAAPGAPFNNRQAAVIGKELEKLGDNFSPADVVERAKTKRSRLHEYFEWDDTAAAKQHRLAQARRIVSCVRVVIRTEDGQPEQTRAFHSVRIRQTEEVEVRRYSPLAIVAQSPELSQQVVDQALSHLKGWKSRYAQYAGIFTPVLRAIDDLEDKAKTG